MENKFYSDDEFEQFLKETTDNFKMYPSKKVWYSIYNDLHPSRRWPSLAVCLILIFAILFVGVSNNNLINKSSRLTTEESFAINADKTIFNGDAITPNNRPSSTQKGTTTSASNSLDNFSQDAIGSNSHLLSVDERASSLVTIRNGQSSDESFAAANVENNDRIIAATDRTPLTDEAVSIAGNRTKSVSAPLTAISGNSGNTSEIDLQDTDMSPAVATTTTVTPESLKISATSLDASQNKKGSLKNEVNAEDKAWIENFAYENKAAVNKFKANASIEYYVTPSVGFRYLKKNNNFEPLVNQQGLVALNSTPSSLDVNDEVTQKSAINMEAGVTLLYNVAKKLRLKAGFQLNYTSYISFADELKHPAQTYMMFNTNSRGYSIESRLSGYANSITGDKKEKLNNKTVQLSLPVGADFRILGKNNLKWYAGATLQPSIITGGQVYAISADTKYYVEENSLLRKFNMNAGLETFISYKTPGGITINAGPQLRYQFLSTYSKKYSYTEKLYNVGLKLGISKSF